MGRLINVEIILCIGKFMYSERGIPEELEDDEKVLEIYENLNDKLKATSKLLDLKKERVR